MAITKNTMLSLSLGTVISVLGGLWFTVDKVQGAFNQLSINTQAIESIGMAMELRGIDRQIDGKQKEVRGLEVEVINNADNTALVNLLNSQINTLEDEIKQLHVVRDCVVDPTKKVCQ